MEWYLQVIKNYANFKGRARRAEYWMFTLFCLFFSLFAVALDNVFEIAMANIGFGPLYILYVLAVFLPALSATVRRLHDVGKSGWTLLILLIPIVGVLWVFLQLIKNGIREENQYGPCPKKDV
ncbi:DUF805 domain-containing protein [Flagellimonas algicola]|uniref:DUF805 domain-containing protein n=1 Tax=Flagellimonas algicola TaxID=2583815 RepID=A0ABY2WH60_9FLAO|nr:DUF805 domain-containing protein [Allomuricauda algicola]TMU50923.1 DUF805 domain-containing protein [Allomuricauda algicola]